MDAAILIGDLEPLRQARPVWDRAAEMILLAATTGAKADIAKATRQTGRRARAKRTGGKLIRAA